MHSAVWTTTICLTNMIMLQHILWLQHVQHGCEIRPARAGCASTQHAQHAQHAHAESESCAAKSVLSMRQHTSCGHEAPALTLRFNLYTRPSPRTSRRTPLPLPSAAQPFQGSDRTLAKPPLNAVVTLPVVVCHQRQARCGQLGGFGASLACTRSLPMQEWHGSVAL